MSFVEDKIEESQDKQQEQPKRDPRYYIADELLQTEKNYVAILTTVVKVSVYYMYMYMHAHARARTHTYTHTHTQNEPRPQ